MLVNYIWSHLIELPFLLLRFIVHSPPTIDTTLNSKISVNMSNPLHPQFINPQAINHSTIIQGGVSENIFQAIFIVIKGQ